SSALAMRRLASAPHLAKYLSRWGNLRNWGMLDYLGVFACIALGNEILNDLNCPFYLLRRHRLDAAGMLDLHLARNQKRTDFHIGRRLLLTHLCNRGRPVLFEVGSEREQEILVERPSRSLQGPARVPPLPGGQARRNKRW